MPKLTLKQAIAQEEHASLTPAIKAEQLALIKSAKPLVQKDIENIMHGKIDPTFKVSDVKAYQQLAVYRTNKGMPIFPFKLKLKPKNIHPLY
ncbi:MAG: hypothetical protein SH818_02270 [Saprospiraceae bacterium]|nr:hypothetical protein [Saprospiraceae bacterium]